MVLRAKDKGGTCYTLEGLYPKRERHDVGYYILQDGEAEHGLVVRLTLLSEIVEELQYVRQLLSVLEEDG